MYTEVPHLRYTAGRPPHGVPINVDGLCPHHEKTFAAHFVASHLTQYAYPGMYLYVSPQNVCLNIQNLLSNK